MTDCYFLPASIECKSAALKTRKMLIGLPVKHHILNILVFRCTLDRNSSATIVKELYPKKALLDNQSLLDKDTSINGDSISVLSEKPIKKNKEEIKKGSSTHKASFLKTKAYTYAKLEKAYRSFENMTSR